MSQGRTVFIYLSTLRGFVLIFLRISQRKACSTNFLSNNSHIDSTKMSSPEPILESDGCTDEDDRLAWECTFLPLGEIELFFIRDVHDIYEALNLVMHFALTQITRCFFEIS